MNLRGYSIFGILEATFFYLRTKLFLKNARFIRFPIHVRGKKWIEFGDNFTSGRHNRIEAFPSAGEKVIFIGDNVQINDFNHIAAIFSVSIGSGTLIASKVFISDHNHGDYLFGGDTNSPLTLPALRPLCVAKVCIGRNVWIGENVVILPGVSIGDGSVIGAGAVLARSIPANSIAVGNPARVIKVYDNLLKKWVKC